MGTFRDEIEREARKLIFRVRRQQCAEARHRYQLAREQGHHEAAKYFWLIYLQEAQALLKLVDEDEQEMI